MSNRTRQGLLVAGLALALGVLADVLLKVTPWGINAAMWTGAFAGAVWVLAPWRRAETAGEGRWLLLPAVLLAGGYAWTDSTTLRMVDGIAAAAVLGLAVFNTRAGRARLASLTDYLLGLVVSLGYAVLGIFELLGLDITWREIPREGWTRKARPVLVGLGLSAPVLVLFGWLFTQADPVFGSLISGWFRWDLTGVGGHLLMLTGWAWVASGLLRAAAFGTAVGADQLQRPAGMRLGMTEVGIVLGMLTALFGLFVVVQVRYFFGGQEHVQAIAGLTAAEYARRGFFELVTVAGLALPLLLFADWIARRDNRFQEYLFRSLAGVLVVLLGVVMVSAAQRMRLYQESFGLTELRFYVSAFMGWLGLVLLAFLVTVLRGRREQFAFAALVTGIGTVVALNLANPDALIVRTNAALATVQRPLDADYVAALSADAAPEIARLLPTMNEPTRSRLMQELQVRWGASRNEGWRSWNRSRLRARAAVRSLGQTVSASNAN